MSRTEAAGVVVAFQGEHGAYSEAAARQLFEGALGEGASGLHYCGLQQFADVFAAVQKGSAMYGVVPVENTLGGSIHANYDLLLRCSDLHVVAELDFQVRHCLIVPPGCSRSEVSVVMSHWQALAQCEGYLRSWGVRTQASFDTAGSVKLIKEQGLRDAAAIASELAAEVHGFEVIARNIQDVQFNHTRFLLLSREPCMGRELNSVKGVKTTVIFWVPHTPGSLFRAVAAFSLRGIQVLKTESRPVPPQHWKELEAKLRSIGQAPGPGAKYHYIFYLDLAANTYSEEMQNALENLRELTPLVRVIGPYPTGGALTNDVILRTQAAMPATAGPTKNQEKGLRIGIIGFGKFGQFMSRRLAEKNSLFVTAIEPELAEVAGATSCVWVPWQNAVNEMLLTHQVEVIVISTSILSFSDVVGQMPAEAIRKAKPLMVDVLSVKTYAKQVMLQSLPRECDILCTHPMFGPISGKTNWHGLPFVFEMVRTQSWERTQQFLSLFESAGCRMVSMSCEEHDKQSASSQFITHLTGRVLKEHGCTATPVDTVGFQNLCTIAEHVGEDSFDLFYGLFKYNPNSVEQLNAFKQGIADVERKLQERSEEDSTCQSQEEEASSMKPSACDDEIGCSPPSEVLHALCAAAEEGKTKYTVVQGDIELRKAICEDLQRRKAVEYMPSQILVSCGAQQAIYQAMLAVCEEGDAVLVPTPCWAGYPEIIRSCRAAVVPIETVASSGYILQPGDLLAALLASQSRCRMLVLCNPCNPTGAVIPRDGLEALAEVLRRPEFAHIYILADEVHERITYDVEHVCFASLPGMHQRTLLVNGFSKAFAMTGMRMGYLAAAHDAAAKAAIKLQGQITSCASSVVQRGALAALQGGTSVDAWYASYLKQLRQNRDYVLTRLKELDEVDCVSPSGASCAMPDLGKILQRSGCKASSAADFCSLLQGEYRVALTPGEACLAPGRVCISYACEMTHLQATMDAFMACVRALI